MMMKLRRLPMVILIAALFVLSSCSKNDTQVQRRGGQNGEPYSPGTVVKNALYGSNTNWLGQNEQLLLDVYIPPSSGKHPLLLFIHGGGFEVGDKETAEPFATLMQQKGFVTAPINYRIGWTHDETDLCNGDSVEAVEAFYRAIQDTRAALRYLVANADMYSIDTNWVFISGASAGGVSTLGVTYYNTQETIDKYMPGMHDKLGPLDADNNLTAKYTIKADVAMWGALGTLDVVTPSSAVPTIFFHGVKDQIVPYDVDHFYMCDNMPIAYGTKPLYDKLTSMGVPAVAQVDPNGGHGVYTIPFRADNTACFLNNLMNKQPESGFYINKPSCP